MRFASMARYAAYPASLHWAKGRSLEWHAALTRFLHWIHSQILGPSLQDGYYRLYHAGQLAERQAGLCAQLRRAPASDLYAIWHGRRLF